MWKIELFAVLVQLVLLFFAIDVHFKANFESFEVCNLEKLAERFVLITSGDFDLSNITDPLIRSKVKTGLSGKAKGEEGDCKGLSSVIYGYGRAPFSFLYMQDQESIFSRIKTNYFGHHQSTYPGFSLICVITSITISQYHNYSVIV
ncbi:uncharacterized protein LOC106661872 isoform X2 [Cimex lectularius]|uniref:Uncharacterized protein n=1 Tax=Cimex lectularius TaxID=79782 RepID=A0A8I6R8R8_CIMLE|nr:uncharacterized protein LOC106661872 isoform X2 [Cimex lectularius]